MGVMITLEGVDLYCTGVRGRIHVILLMHNIPRACVMAKYARNIRVYVRYRVLPYLEL